MSRRLKKIQVDAELLVQMLQGHPMSRVESNLPPDTEFIGVDYDRTGIFTFTAKSETWDELPRGAIIPNFEPTMVSTWDPHGLLLDMVAKNKPHVWLYMFDEPSHAYLLERFPGGYAPARTALCGRGRHKDMRLAEELAALCAPCAALLDARSPLT